MISQSQINCYLNCSKRYYYKYIKKFPAMNYISGKNLFLGSFIHRFLENHLSNKKIQYQTILLDIIKEMEDYHKIGGFDLLEKIIDEYKITNKFELNDLKEVILDVFFNELFFDNIQTLKTKTKTEINTYNTAITLCENLKTNEKLKSILSKIVQIEHEYRLEYNEIIGFLDLIGYNKNFKSTIIDFKISKRNPNEEKITQKKIQDKLYCYLYYKNHKEIPTFKYIYIIYNNIDMVEIKDIIEQDIEMDENDLNDIEETIKSFKKGIENEVFIKNEGHWSCSPSYCQYYALCNKAIYINHFNNNEEA